MPFAVALLAVGGLAFAGGGFDPPVWNAATVALAWVAAGALLLRRVALGRAETLALAAWAALAGWAALSVAWSASVPLSVLDAQRLLVPLLALGAFLAVGATRGTLEGVVAAATAASLWNLFTRGGAGETSGADAEPLGYANGLAILAGIGLLLALGLARERPAWLLACLPPAAVLLLADSRGALVAVLGGAVVAAAPWLWRSLAAAGVALGVLAVAFSEERTAYWRASLESIADHPLLGTGAGTWVRAWLAERGEPFPARDAHGLYVETLAELGPVGLALVLVALLLPLTAARAAPRNAVAAYAAFVLHAGVDWDLELTAVAVAGVACGAYLLAAAPRPRRAVASQWPLAPAAAALLALALLPGNLFEALARDALRDGDAATAASRAETAATLAPWASEPWRLRGEALRELGEPAAWAFRVGLERDGGDVELWRALARASEGEERRRALERARRLDPLGSP